MKKKENYTYSTYIGYKLGNKRNAGEKEHL